MTCQHTHKVPYTITPEPPKGFKGKPATQSGVICASCKLFMPK